MSKKDLLIQGGIVLIASLLFIPFLGRVHLFDWDEINFAESAREMIVSGDYLTVQIFFEPFWEKPPLFIWMQVLSMKIFGINEFAARFPNAICGIVTLLVLFNLGRKLYDARFGLLWVVAYAGSLLSFFYFKSGIIDPWFNLFIFASVASWVYAINTDSSRNKYLLAILSASLLGLAILTKGPVSVLVFGLVVLVLFILNKFRVGLNVWQVLSFLFFLTLVGGFWFILQILDGNYQTVVDFIVYQIRLFSTQDAGHGGFPGYHFIVLLFGLFPASVFAIQGHKYMGGIPIRRSMHFSMVALLWIVLILFSVVKTKIVHYSSLTYFPLTYLAAYSAYLIIEGEFTFKRWMKITLGSIAVILGIVTLIMPWVINNKDLLIEKGLITHSFTIGNLEANPDWGIFHSFIGLVIISGVALAIFGFRDKPVKKILTLFYSSLLYIFLVMTFYIPGAELISQNAAIEYIKEKAGENVYIHSFHKSYAILFYSKQPVPENPKAFDQVWLTSDKIDKDAYFLMRIDKREQVLHYYPRVEIIGEKNGYVFGINRKPDKNNQHDK